MMVIYSFERRHVGKHAVQGVQPEATSVPVRGTHSSVPETDTRRCLNAGAYVGGEMDDDVPLARTPSSNTLLNEKEVTRNTGRDAILDFLRAHSCYDLIRESGKVGGRPRALVRVARARAPCVRDFDPLDAFRASAVSSRSSCSTRASPFSSPSTRSWSTVRATVIAAPRMPRDRHCADTAGPAPSCALVQICRQRHFGTLADESSWVS